MTVPNTDRETVLVIGATGRHGGTGGRVVERLQAAGRDVRALVRTDDERAQRLRASGVHVVVGDLHDRRTLLPALQGVSSVFVAYPVAAGIVEALLNLASATIELGISPHVVIMGAAAADHSSPSGIARAHALSEEMLLDLGVSFTPIRGSAFFYENVLLLHRDTIRSSGEFANSFGDARPAWISGSDAADLCATVLLDRQTYPNVPYGYPPGYALMSQKDIAAIISKETGREVHHRYLTPEEWGRDLRTRTDNHPMIEHITNQIGNVREQHHDLAQGCRPRCAGRFQRSASAQLPRLCAPAPCGARRRHSGHRRVRIRRFELSRAVIQPKSRNHRSR